MGTRPDSGSHQHTAAYKKENNANAAITAAVGQENKNPQQSTKAHCGGTA